MPDWLDFTGKVALVTGSSRGIGAGMIQAFDRLGARCAVNCVADPQGRNRADAEQVASKLKDPLLVECDVGDLASVTAMLEQVRQKFGGLDILINNAGIIRDRTIKKMTES